MAVNVLVLETYAEKYAQHLRAHFHGVHVYPVSDVADLKIDAAEIDVLVAFGIAVNDDLIRKATRLRWIQSLATGVDHFLRCPSLRPDILLTSARGIHGPAMRETVVYFMLALSRDVRRLVRNQANHVWDRGRPWPLLCGKTATIVGIGASAGAIAQLLKSLGMRVVGVTRMPRTIEGFDATVHTERLAEAVAGADYVIGILPGTDENIGRIDAAVLGAMKPTAFFINVGRGETVDEPALIAALRNNRIAGAGLDVFRAEPLPADSPLWDMPNVVLCPHIGGLFTEYEDYVMPILAENMRLFLAGAYRQMRNLVPH